MHINSFIMHPLKWQQDLYDICLYKTQCSIIQFRHAEDIIRPTKISLENPIIKTNNFEMTIIKDHSKRTPAIESNNLDNHTEQSSFIDYQTHIQNNIQNAISVIKYSTRSILERTQSLGELLFYPPQPTQSTQLNEEPQIIQPE